MIKDNANTFFAPQLFIKSGIRQIDFYINGLGAVEHRRWSNNDGSIHVAELSIEGALFHLHEESPKKGFLAPDHRSGVTTMMGIFVSDVDALMKKAINAGATEINPAQDYDYGYRQGELKDPFGHHWLIEMKI
jgi:PhnB protein